MLSTGCINVARFKSTATPHRNYTAQERTPPTGATPENPLNLDDQNDSNFEESIIDS